MACTIAEFRQTGNPGPETGRESLVDNCRFSRKNRKMGDYGQVKCGTPSALPRPCADHGAQIGSDTGCEAKNVDAQRRTSSPLIASACTSRGE